MRSCSQKDPSTVAEAMIARFSAFSSAPISNGTSFTVRAIGLCIGIVKSASSRSYAERNESIFSSTASRSTLPTSEMRALDG